MKESIDTATNDLLRDSMGRGFVKVGMDIVKNNLDRTILGEYQIALEQVNYKRCEEQS